MKVEKFYFGHLYKGRGVGLILKLSSEMPNVDFHLVGGTEDDIIFWKGKQNPDNLFFHGYVRPSIVYKYRNNCDILIQWR